MKRETYLSSRLRRLQQAGVVTKTPSGSYALTQYGEGLRTPVIGLGLWGLGLPKLFAAFAATSRDHLQPAP